MNRLPLSGIRVLDFTHALAGPYSTMLMADLGADVIKIEHPVRGDGTRHMGVPLVGPMDTDYYLAFNRNKRSVGLDLKTVAGRLTALRIAEHCDVVAHNFRPGVMKRLGLNYEDIRRVNPRAVYLAISGFGEHGELAELPANDITMQAMAGLMATTGIPGEAPLRIGVSLVDISTGAFALAGVLAALRSRDQSGEGERVHVSMLASAIGLLSNYVPAVLSGGQVVQAAGRGHHQLVPYQIFEAADGRYMIVGAFTDSFWRSLCSAVGLPELALDERFSSNFRRVENRDVLIPILEKRFKDRPRDAWIELLREADVPSSPVNSVAEALRHSQVEAANCLTRVEKDGVTVTLGAIPIQLGGTESPRSSFPPALGADTEEVLRELGITAETGTKVVERPSPIEPIKRSVG